MATIAQNLARLQTARISIADAITAKGGTVNNGDGFEDFPADISSIPSGGGDVKIGTFSIDTGTIDSGATDIICIKKNKVILAYAFTPNNVIINSGHNYYYLHFDDFDITPIEDIKLIRIDTETGKCSLSNPMRTEYSNNRLCVVVLSEGTSFTLTAAHRFVLITLP